MTKSEAIKKLAKKYESYDLGTEAVSAPAGTFLAKAVIQILDHVETGTRISRKTSSYGSGSNLIEAQDAAIVSAIENLGL